MPVERRSRQREAIYTELCHRYDHPTAEELYESLKEKNMDIGIATVYRNLRSMADSGKIKVLHTDNVDHFDATVEEHFHFYCRKCKSLTDLPDFSHLDGAKLMEQAQESSGLKVESMSLIFYGICEGCLE